MVYLYVRVYEFVNICIHVSVIDSTTLLFNDTFGSTNVKYKNFIRYSKDVKYIKNSVTDRTWFQHTHTHT